VILLKSRYYSIGQAVLIAGAIGIHHTDTDPYLGWVWVHPTNAVGDWWTRCGLRSYGATPVSAASMKTIELPRTLQQATRCSTA
jgi:hypothetical protein